MKILVAISAVPDTTSKINFTENNQEFDKNGIQFIINPQDEYCLTKALQLQETQNAEVTTITVGDASVEPVIRKALAIGAKEAIRVNIVPLDSQITAKEIASVAKQENFDIIFLGKESLDYNGGAVPGLTAAELDYPFVNDVVNIDLKENKTVEVVRELDSGKETITLSLPVVLAGQKGLVKENEIKMPNMRGIVAARTKKITLSEPENSENKIKIINYKKPKSRSQVTLIDPNDLDELIKLLHEEAKVI